MSLYVERSFIENSEYLHKLIDEVSSKSIDSIDSNLLYEVAYANTYLGTLLSSADTVLTEELKEVKGVLSGILSSVDYDRVANIKKEVNYKKLLKCKYDDLEIASYDKSYCRDNNPISFYIKKNIFKFLMFSVFFIIVLINPTLSGILSKYYLSIGMPNAESICSVVSTIINLISILAMSSYAISITLDIAYITIPVIRYTVEGIKINQFFSQSAIDAIEYYYNNPIIYSKVKDFNRIERNKIWLDTMLEFVNAGVLNDNEFCSSINKLKTNLDSVNVNSKGYYILMSKIEFLHDVYLELI